MTLLVAVTGADGLVLAADSRGTFGDPSQTTAQNDSQQKAHVLCPHVASLMAGQGEVGTLLVQEATATIAGADIGATPAMEQLRSTCRDNYNAWFPTIDAIQPPALVMSGEVPIRPNLTFIVGGYEVGQGGAGESRLYRLSSFTDFAPALSDYGFAVDGVAQYALYLLNRLYQPERIAEELTALAVYVITETASQDGKVGGPVKVITIKPDEGCEVLSESSIQEVVRTNDVRSSVLRDSFFRPEEVEDGN